MLALAVVGSPETHRGQGDAGAREHREDSGVHVVRRGVGDRSGDAAGFLPCMPGGEVPGGCGALLNVQAIGVMVREQGNRQVMRAGEPFGDVARVRLVSDGPVDIAAVGIEAGHELVVQD